MEPFALAGLGVVGVASLVVCVLSVIAAFRGWQMENVSPVLGFFGGVVCAAAAAGVGALAAALALKR